MDVAATVAGAMTLLAKPKAKVNFMVSIPMVENTPDNTAALPGEVIQYRDELTVQVGNTGAIAGALGTELGGFFADETLSAYIILCSYWLLI